MKLARYAKQYITVILSGEGADEAFFGYPKYKYMVHRRTLEILMKLNSASSLFLPNIWKFKLAKKLVQGVPNFKAMFVEAMKNASLSNFFKPNNITSGYEPRLAMLQNHNRAQRCPHYGSGYFTTSVAEAI